MVRCLEKDEVQGNQSMAVVRAVPTTGPGPKARSESLAMVGPD